ncbi:unnamed protein product [Ceratitis capitata]|uniref:(Mediterranean fruit fly) hypothetical protein n=1 Tax=Ceratitis capitata TaxID=7213 RepID=A0A811UP15_CERCA|nr:unnamed protein product [Ceratitis capitata]
MPKRNSKSQLPSRAKNQYSKFVTTALLKVELNSLSGWDEAQEMQYLMDSAVVESLACQVPHDFAIKCNNNYYNNNIATDNSKSFTLNFTAATNREEEAATDFPSNKHK